MKWVTWPWKNLNSSSEWYVTFANSSVLKNMKKILGLIFLCGSLPLLAQEKKPVQISGVVITAEEKPQFVPYAHAVVKNRKGGGTMTDPEGFFSLAVLPGDTLVFTSMGFKHERLVIPDTLKQKEYLAKISLKRDTTLLEEVTLYPWPTPDRFKEAFLRTKIPTTEEDIAQRNLAVEELKERAEAMGYSPEEIQDYVISAHNADIYNYGRYQGYSSGGAALLGSLTDPFAWARFFEALKRGDFKKN